MDLTAQHVNNHTTASDGISAAIFVNSGGNVHLDLNALTGDALNGADLSTVNLNEAMIKLLQALSEAAKAVHAANNLEDARSSYPELRTLIKVLPTGDRVIEFSGSVISQAPISLDNADAV